MDGTPEARRLVLRPLSGKSQVSEASDALSGVELALKTQPDLALLDSLPLALSGAPLPLVLHLASVGGLGPPAVFILSQWAAHPRWSKRLTGLPGLFCLSLGLMLNNTWAVLKALFGRPEFARTPKLNLTSDDKGWRRSDYVLKPDGMVWGQPALAAHMVLTLVAAVKQMPGLVPFLVTMAAACSYLMAWELGQAVLARPASADRRRTVTFVWHESPRKIC